MKYRTRFINFQPVGSFSWASFSLLNCKLRIMISTLILLKVVSGQVVWLGISQVSRITDIRTFLMAFINCLFRAVISHIRKKNHTTEWNTTKPKNLWGLRSWMIDLFKVTWLLDKVWVQNPPDLPTLGLGTFNCTALSLCPEAQWNLCPFSSYWKTNNSENCPSESFIESVEVNFISKVWLLCDLSWIPFSRHGREVYHSAVPLVSIIGNALICIPVNVTFNAPRSAFRVVTSLKFMKQKIDISFIKLRQRQYLFYILLPSILGNFTWWLLKNVIFNN